MFFSLISLFYFFSTSIASSSDAIELSQSTGSRLDLNSGLFKVLEKKTAETRTFSVKVGEMFHFGSLTLQMTHCISDSKMGDFSLIQVFSDEKDGLKSIRAGWLSADRRTIGFLQHPDREIRLIKCGDNL